MPPLEVTFSPNGYPERIVIPPGGELRHTFKDNRGLVLFAVRCLESDRGGAVLSKPIDNDNESDSEDQSFLPQDGATLRSLIRSGGTESFYTSVGSFTIEHFPSEDN